MAACLLLAGGTWLAWSGSGAAQQVGSGSGAIDPVSPAPAPPLHRSAESGIAAREEVSRQPVVEGYCVQVVTAAGEPVAGAAVFLGAEAWRADGSGMESLGAEIATDHDGRAQFEHARGDWSCIAVIAPGHAPLWQRRLVASGVQAVELADSVSVSGVVTVDGAPPRTPIGLELRGYLDPTEGWPEAARSWLRAKTDGVGALKTSSGPGGSFAFHGLAGGVAVRLLGPIGLRSRDGGAALRAESSLVTPRLGVRLDLATLPAIRGRLASRTGAEPQGLVSGLYGGWERVPQGIVTLRYRFVRAKGSWREGHEQVSVNSGFSLPFHETDLERFELDVFEGITIFGGKHLAHRELEGPLRESCDLGEIDLDGGQRVLQIVVRNSRGEPIAGAKVAAGGVLVGETDGAGVARCTLRPAVETLAVGALAYRLARVAVPPAPQENLLVTLQAANRLRFVVVAAEPAHRAGLLLRTDIPTAFHADDPELVAGFAGVRGAVPGGGMFSSTGSHSHLYDFPQDGVLELWDLPAGEAFELSLRDRFDRVQWQERITLRAGERREIRHVLQQFPRELRARIVDASGRALGGASVQAGIWDIGRSADAEGWFTLEAVHGRSPAATVSAQGYVARHLPEGFLDTEGTVALEPARQLWVELRDAAGNHVEADVTWRAPDGFLVGAAQREPGLVRIDGVPLRAGELLVRQSGGEESRHPVGASETRVRITPSLPR